MGTNVIYQDFHTNLLRRCLVVCPGFRQLEAGWRQRSGGGIKPKLWFSLLKTWWRVGVRDWRGTEHGLSAHLATVWLQSSWESTLRCSFHPVTFRAVSSVAATLSQHSNTTRPLWPNTDLPNLCASHLQVQAPCPTWWAGPTGRVTAGQVGHFFAAYLAASSRTQRNFSTLSSCLQNRPGTDLQGSMSWRPKWQRCRHPRVLRTTQVCVTHQSHLHCSSAPTGKTALGVSDTK